MRCTEAVATLDADVLVVTATPDVLDPLGALCDSCRDHGYAPEGEAARAGACPVQFIPVFSPLWEEAVGRAETADFDGTPFAVDGAVYPAVLALGVGRAKGFVRVLALLEPGAFTRGEPGTLAERHAHVNLPCEVQCVRSDMQSVLLADRGYPLRLVRLGYAPPARLT